MQTLRQFLVQNSMRISAQHDMNFVRSIARKVTVLHEGSVLAEGDMDHVQNHPRVIEVYLGA